MNTVEGYLELARKGQIPDTNETYFVSQKVKDYYSWARLVSDCTIEYLNGTDRPRSSRFDANSGGEQLTILKGGLQKMKMCPLKTKMDGNCLLHAVAKAIWGIEGVYHEVMRRLVTEELTEHKAFYQDAVDKKSDDDYNDSEYDIFLQESRKSGEKLQVIHIFALCNIIRRPIILYASEIDMYQLGVHEQGVAGLILPTRHGAQSVTGRPIAITWSDDLRNHYVPLCLFEGEQFEWPLLTTVYQKSLKEGETFKDYITYDNTKENKNGLASLMMQVESERASMFDKKSSKRFSDSYQKEKEEFSSSSSRAQMMNAALEMLKKLQQQQLKEANKEYNKAKNQKMKQGKAQYRYSIVGDKLVRILDDTVEDEDEDEIEYDIVVPVALKSKQKQLLIGFNFGDDPLQVAIKWVNKLKMPSSNIQPTAKFVQNYQIYARENPEKFTTKKKVKKTMISTVRNPTKSFRLIPFNGNYSENQILNPQNFASIIETIEKNNLKLSQNDMNELKNLNAIVVGKDYNNATFSQYSLELITAALKPDQWPDASLFQIIDFLRVIILFKNSSTYFLERASKVGFESTVFGLLMAQAVGENLAYPKIKTILGFIGNLFFQKNLHSFIIKYQFRIIHIISDIVNKKSESFDEGKKTQIYEIAFKIISNYALLWKNNIQHSDPKIQSDTANFAMRLILDVLNAIPPSKLEGLLLQGLVLIGTILLKNGAAKINPQDVQKWSTSQNTNIAESAQYIAILLSSEVVNEHCI
jgi:hypothetical protein